MSGAFPRQAVGSAAPWFVLGVMCFSYAVRAVYIESCVLFVRGGVYRVVKAALGAKLAKFSVSALMFDYVLTGPISGVSAGQYLVGLVNEVFHLMGLQWAIPRGPGAAVTAIAVTLYFWRKNVIGIHESSDKALRIMQVTTVMVVLMIVWCGITLMVRGGNLPPAPVPENLTFSPESLGWLHGTDWVRKIGLLGILIAFGHSILAMSGEESLAQVNREIAYPKVKNLKRAALVIFVFSILVYLAGLFLRRHDHSGFDQAGILREPHQRSRHERRGALSAASGLSTLRGSRRLSSCFQARSTRPS